MTLSRAIQQTLAYCDHFSYPLTKSEIWRRLIGVACTRQQVGAELTRLHKKGSIGKSGEYYFLPGKEKNVETRSLRRDISRPLRIRAHHVAARLCAIPWVQAAYLTGSLAMNNARAGDDIDLMIVTANDRLWITRLFLTVITSVQGLRRTPTSKNVAGKICLNLYLTPRSFVLPDSKRSLYTAYELIQAVPLCDSHNTQSQLLRANKWIHDYLPNCDIPRPTQNTRVPEYKHSSLLDTILSIGETICYRLQLWHMKKRRTREYITPDTAFFHPYDPGKRVLSKIKL